MTQTALLTNQYHEDLIDFRESYPLQRLHIQQTGWTYYDTGGDRFPLLLLAGGGGQAEAMFPQISLLADKFRVIVPNIPSTVKHMEDVIDGLSTLMNALDIKKSNLYGVSLGGHIAQIYIRKHYVRVRDCILSHTAIPTEQLAQKTSMQYRMLQLYPSVLITRLFKRMTQQQIKACPVKISDTERAFWQNYFEQQYDAEITKAQIVSRASIARDYFSEFTFHGTDLNYWQGRMLIIESSRDDVYDEGERGALLAMYTRAWIHTFEGYTHLATILAHRQLAELVIDFFKGDAYDGV